MESDNMNVQKQRKIIMMVNGEKKEIIFNDKDKVSGSNKISSSKRKSKDRSQSPSKRKKSSERGSTSSKHKSLKEDNTTEKNNTKESKSDKSEKSSSGSSKHKSSEKSSKKSSSDQKSSTTSHKSNEKDKSSNKTNSSSESKTPKVQKDESLSSKHKSSYNSTIESDLKPASKGEQKHSESSKHKSSKTIDKSIDQGSASSSKDKSSRSNDKSSDQSPSKHKSSSKSFNSSPSSSKRSKSSEKSSSLNSKRKKSSEKSKSDKKEQKSSSENHTELIKQEMEKIKEENMKFMTAMFDKIREELGEQTKKVIENVLNSRESFGIDPNSIDPKPFCDDEPDLVQDKHSDKDCSENFKHQLHSIVPEYYYADRHDLTDIMKRRLAIINAPPVKNYSDDDYAYICIGGQFVPKCKFDYFVDPMDNILKYRKIEDFSHLAEPFEKPNDDKTEIVVPNTEIPLHEISNLSQTESNQNLKTVIIKSENVDNEEVLTKPVPVFSLYTTQPAPDSKENIPISTVKSEPQPHCSNNIPPNKIKQELSIDSREYFRVIPQNSSNSEIPVIEDSEKLKTLADMSLINKWIASQNKNHGFKDKEALSLMMSKKSLFSLFKCMGINCCFTTICPNNFLDHLNIHMDENCSTNDCFLNCAYCLDKFEKPTDLLEHYKSFHYNCIYQCNLCFYRAAEQQSVYDHQAHYHTQDIRKCEILECPNVFPKDEKAEEQKVLNKVKDIKECLSCELCFEEFIVPEDCIKHLKSNHQIAEEKDKSEEQVKKINVNFTNNRIGKYQCLECDSTKPFGSNSRIEMRSHLHHHPRSLHYVCVRETDHYKHIRIKSRGDLQTRKYNGDLELLKNAEGILKITTV